MSRWEGWFLRAYPESGGAAEVKGKVTCRRNRVWVQGIKWEESVRYHLQEQEGMPVMGQDSSRHSYLRDAMLEKARKGTHSQIHGTGPTGNIVLNVALVTLTHLIFKATFIKLPPTNPLPYWHNYPHLRELRLMICPNSQSCLESGKDSNPHLSWLQSPCSVHNITLPRGKSCLRSSGRKLHCNKLKCF